MLSHSPERPTKLTRSACCPVAGRALTSPSRSHASLSWLLGSHPAMSPSTSSTKRGPPEQGGVEERHPLMAHNRTTNALVTHLQQGLEVVHLFTGRGGGEEGDWAYAGSMGTKL